MSVLDETGKRIGRARYTAAQGLRSAWYGAQYMIAKRRSAGFNRPGEPPFKPQNPVDTKELRAAYFRLFAQDRANIEAGLYPAPEDVRVAAPNAIALAAIRMGVPVDASVVIPHGLL